MYACKNTSLEMTQSSGKHEHVFMHSASCAVPCCKQARPRAVLTVLPHPRYHDIALVVHTLGERGGRVVRSDTSTRDLVLARLPARACPLFCPSLSEHTVSSGKPPTARQALQGLPEMGLTFHHAAPLRFYVTAFP